MLRFATRRLTEHEWQVWRDVRLAALRDAPEAFYSTLEREQAYDEATWRHMMEPSRGVKVVASAGDSPVGVVGGQVSNEVRDAAELFGMWVSPAARGTGVAAGLVHEVVTWAGEQGRTRMRLWVVDGNDRARRLYARLGFATVDEFHPHPRDVTSRYQLMACDLRATTHPGPRAR